MSKRADPLALRRAELLRRAQAQRAELAGAARDVRQRIVGIDRGVAALRALVRNPVVIAGGVAVIALIGPRRVLRWGSNGLALFAAAQRALRRERAL